MLLKFLDDRAAGVRLFFQDDHTSLGHLVKETGNGLLGRLIVSMNQEDSPPTGRVSEAIGSAGIGASA
jgi:hypothetical protein